MNHPKSILIGVAAVALILSLTPRAYACGPPNANNQINCTPGVDDCNYLLAKQNPGYADSPHCWGDPTCDAPTGHGGYYCNNSSSGAQYCDGTCCYNPDAPANVSTYCGTNNGECCGPSSVHCHSTTVNWVICPGGPNSYGTAPQTSTDFSFGCTNDLYNDTHSCGACGTACSTFKNTPTCAVGKCTPGTCTFPYANCNATTVNDGCETNLHTPANCGACSNVCPTPANASAATCPTGSCGFTCTAGYNDCNNTPGDGCEIHTTVDINNCGSCGHACAPANSTATCGMAPHAAGTCGHGACTAGFGDCTGVAGGDPGGCATPLNTLSHCGACNVACDAATQFCSPSPSPTFVCVLTGCPAGSNTVNCPPAVSGCATNIATSATNCGGCGVTCSNSHVTPSCVAGVCTGTCAAGFADCNQNLQTDGCEVNTATDTANCGACNAACAVQHAAAVCTQGVCTYLACVTGFSDCDGNTANGCETAGATCPTDMAEAATVDMATAGSPTDLSAVASGGGDGGSDMSVAKGKGKSSGCEVGGSSETALASLLLLLALIAAFKVARPIVARGAR